MSRQSLSLHPAAQTRPQGPSTLPGFLHFQLLSRYLRTSKVHFHGLSAINTLTPLILITECLHVFLLIKAGKRLRLHMH